jgi:hypothetical protein
LHVHEGRADVFGQPDGLSGDYILNLFEDREGNIWVATSDGLDRFREFAIPTISAKRGLSNTLVGPILAAKDGGVWIGSSSGLNRWKNGQITIYRKGSSGLPGDAVESIFHDYRERIWASTNSGVGYFENGHFIPVSAVPGRYVHSIAGDSAAKFRPDLFYRLNVFPIHVPPLRDRPEDILLLAKYFIDRYAAKLAKRIRQVEKRTAELLEAYDWPGNIRELQNVIERAMILCDSDTLSVEESWLRPESESDAGLRPSLSNHQQEIIEAALAQTHGQVAGPHGAAAKLGVPRTTLESKIKGLHIDKNRYRSGDGNFSSHM